MHERREGPDIVAPEKPGPGSPLWPKTDGLSALDLDVASSDPPAPLEELDSVGVEDLETHRIRGVRTSVEAGGVHKLPTGLFLAVHNDAVGWEDPSGSLSETFDDFNFCSSHDEHVHARDE